MTLHFIDIGQGDATLIEFSCGAMLVDTGGEETSEPAFDSNKELVDYLDRFFERRKDLDRTLDLLVLTHQHIDHVRGVPAVLDRYRVKNVVYNGEPGSYPAKEEMEALEAFVAKGSAGVFRSVAEEISSKSGYTSPVVDPIACADVDPSIRLLWGHVERDPGWPKNRWGKPAWGNANNHSVVTRIDYGSASLLITGDLEEHAIDDLLKKYDGSGTLDVDLYHVGHHGSHNGTTRELMEAMSPALAVIPCGSPTREAKWTAWDHGHPRNTVMDLLVDGVSMSRSPVEVTVFAAQETPPEKWTISKAIYSTAWSGDVVIEADAAGRWLPN